MESPIVRAPHRVSKIDLVQKAVPTDVIANVSIVPAWGEDGFDWKGSKFTPMVIPIKSHERLERYEIGKEVMVEFSPSASFLRAIEKTRPAGVSIIADS